MKESSNSPFFKQMLTSYRDYAKKKKEAEKEKPFSYQLTSQTLYLIFSYLKNLQL